MRRRGGGGGQNQRRVKKVNAEGKIMALMKKTRQRKNKERVEGIKLTEGKVKTDIFNEGEMK